MIMISWQNFITKRNDGGKQASYRLYELAKSACPDLDLVIFTNDILGEYESFRMPSHSNVLFRGINILTGHMFTSSALEQKVIDRIKKENFDTVLLDRSMYGTLAKKIKQQCPDVKIWVFLHNIEKNYFKNKISKSNPIAKLVLQFPYKAICKSEKETLYYADKLLTLTQRDSETLSKEYGKSADQVLPMAFYDSFDQSKVCISENDIFDGDILFIGSLFNANYDGIKWFVEKVMPELPNYRLKIVGKNFEEKKVELSRDNVEVIGTVDNLSEYYYANNIMIMPIPYGDGIKIKTAEALMYGKTILASDEALEGYDVNGVDGIYRCNSKEDYISTINKLLSESKKTFCPSVRELFLKNHSLDNQIEECKKIWK